MAVSDMAVCPACGGAGIPILYGLPVAADLFEAADRGEVALGGCVINLDPDHQDPDHRCSSCQHEWCQKPREWIAVPDENALWWPDVSDFALTYNAYDRNGGFEGAAKVGHGALKTWERSGDLPDDLDIARAALFFEQRRYRHLDCQPEGESERYIRSLLGRIAELSDGAVLGPSDPLP
jgi:hypothetical protein